MPEIAIHLTFWTWHVLVICQLQLPCFSQKGRKELAYFIKNRAQQTKKIEGKTQII
jgi:hypothetical protein